MSNSKAPSDKWSAYQASSTFQAAVVGLHIPRVTANASLRDLDREATKAFPASLAMAAHSQRARLDGMGRDGAANGHVDTSRALAAYTPCWEPTCNGVSQGKVG